MQELTTLLHSHDVFKDLNPNELKQLTKIVKKETFKKGEVVFDANKSSHFFYYIISGQLKLHLVNNEVKTLLPGQLFGEIGVVNPDFRSGSVVAGERTETICINGHRLFTGSEIPAETSIKILLSLSKRITNYLRSREQISTKEIIEQGESDTVEFKSTLRWNLRAERKDKAMEKAALKTIAAFMNTNGGTLLIGVKDDGTLLGLSEDRFANQDKMLLHLTKIIQDRIGSLFLQFLNYNIEKIQGKEVLRIDCIPATFPAYYLEDKLEHLYIRTGPSTTDLRLSKVYDYINGRFEL